MGNGHQVRTRSHGDAWVAPALKQDVCLKDTLSAEPAVAVEDR